MADTAAQVSVEESGICGDMALEHELPDGAIYQPADLVKRDERTVLCDINSGELPSVAADVVAILGVLEYCHDPSRLLRAVSQRCRHLILRYNPRDLGDGRDRLSHGWFNSLTSAELIALTIESGYRLEAIVPVSLRERIYWLSTVEVRL